MASNRGQGPHLGGFGEPFGEMLAVLGRILGGFVVYIYAIVGIPEAYIRGCLLEVFCMFPG